MEPAVRREEPDRYGLPVYISPVAAMEPAIDGGVSLDGRRDQSDAVLCAMEPTVDRREHGLVERPLGSTCSTRQWNPPVIGGSTRGMTLQFVMWQLPQWSPPLTSGNTEPKS
jgi:hypothetical protein